MRYRLMATYRGSPFEAGIGPTDGDIVLFAACPPPEDLGFEPATGHWRKQLPMSEVQAVWESRPVGTFRGERCMVLDDLGDRLHIGYLGHDGYQAEQLGYWQVDRGVFELVAARSEVSDIVEERTEYPRHRTAAAGPGGSALPASYPPPGSPQDQAQYLPPEPHGQASYLLGRPDFFRAPDAPAYQQDGYQPDLSPAYPAADPASGQYAWPDPGPALPHPSGPILDRSAPPAQHPSGPILDRSAPPAQPGLTYPVDPERGSGISVPALAEPPLPLEAAALRAASASRPRPETWRPSAERLAEQQAAGSPAADPEPGHPDAPSGRAPGSGPGEAMPASAPGRAASGPGAEPGAVGGLFAAPGPFAVPGPFAAPGPGPDSGPVTGLPTAPAGASGAAATGSGSTAVAAPRQGQTAPADLSSPVAFASPAAVLTEPGIPAAVLTAPAIPADPAVPADPDSAADPTIAANQPAATAEPSAPAEPASQVAPPAPAEAARPGPNAEPEASAAARRRRPARRRLATERVFAELASLAGIPVDSYAIGEEVEGALCLLQTDQGFEVFHSSDGNRHELQFFGSEEAACFYLFGVLAADAVRKGALLSAAGHITGQLPAVRIAP